MVSPGDTLTGFCINYTLKVGLYDCGIDSFAIIALKSHQESFDSSMALPCSREGAIQRDLESGYFREEPRSLDLSNEDSSRSPWSDCV